MNTPTFIKFINPTQDKLILLILNSPVSHVSPELLLIPKKIILPPHSSLKMQPLNCNFLRPSKTYYNDAADCWIATHPGQVPNIYNVAEIFKAAFEKWLPWKMQSKVFVKD
ncbi:hypothetical protein PR048_011997 [Dryococelus australis]|uniref:DDE-1 domain-containing protein n=1 Tax=Dryococelus australis TaxID=614101 RepID=A0ABQ9HN85_9NEOP|nr:hypothetical protein PR048_011997 [Dryococelus australis]